MDGWIYGEWRCVSIDRSIDRSICLLPRFVMVGVPCPKKKKMTANVTGIVPILLKVAPVYDQSTTVLVSSVHEDHFASGFNDNNNNYEMKRECLRLVI